MGSILFPTCESLSPLGIICIATASISIFENSFPLYILLQFSPEQVDVAAKSFVMTVRIYLLALVATDIFGSMMVIPMLLITEYNNAHCEDNLMSYFEIRSFCAITYGGYFAYKLSSMFLVTFTGYSCFLHYNQNKRLHFPGGTIDRKSCACENQVSLATTASTQTNSPIEDYRDKGKIIKHIPRRTTMGFMLLLIIALSLFIAALPSLGLGPFHGTDQKVVVPALSNASIAKTNIPPVSFHKCTLHSFGTPKVEKEYIFLFSILMASGGCGLILIYVFLALFGGRFKSCHSIFVEMTQFVTVQGFLFLATWIPILISICFAMSGKHISQQIQLYLTLITFINCLSHPFLYGYCLSMVKDGYKRILTHFLCLTKCLLLKKNAEGGTMMTSERETNSSPV